MANDVINNVENEEVIEGKGEVVTVETTKKPGLFTRAKNWWSEEENREKVKGTAVKVGAGFLGGLTVGLGLAKKMSKLADGDCEDVDISDEITHVLSDDDEATSLDDFDI